MTNKGHDRRKPAAKQANRQPEAKREATLHAKAPAKKKTGIAVKQSRQSETVGPDIPVRQIPWWFTPEHQRAHGPGGAHIGGLLPPRPPGPGPHPGPGPFPPPRPPGPFPPGPGPFPPGPGPFPPGPGPFPPPRPPGPFPPGPGPFPPPRPPFPVPIPIPVPIPVPGPVPVPVPLPGPSSFVAVTIEGGIGLPNVSGTSYVTFYPGMTLRQALYATGRVQFGPNGFIVSVAGIPVGGAIGLTVRYNGRVIPQTLLDQPITPGSTITLSLFYL
ncbi:hypothetical protein [Cohnella rhizosphaerae]|uniref:Uncharacterized protein n=1 Tax=Cohnella rhizosphaerae TaxID=1457232 RepID=A0A9X4L1F8_9BACL|nr:hypothetical protein [Cohnella rhizosphaerae]MDG0814366.1 hypothetical protein [Cohnella rhizosphaerae]